MTPKQLQKELSRIESLSRFALKHGISRSTLTRIRNASEERPYAPHAGTIKLISDALVREWSWK